MASTSISTLIIFIASVVVAAGVAGTMATEVSRISDAMDEQSTSLSKNIATDIEIISDSGSEIYNGSDTNVTIHIKNTGERTLDPDQVDIFVDGQYEGSFNTTVEDGDEWIPGNVVRFEIDTGSLNSGDHRVKVVIYKNEDVFRFRV